MLGSPEPQHMRRDMVSCKGKLDLTCFLLDIRSYSNNQTGNVTVTYDSSQLQVKELLDIVIAPCSNEAPPLAMLPDCESSH